MYDNMNEQMQTAKANRIHIGFFGRCNAGKSTLINMITGQPIALVSEVAGTTTDPVSKSMEILPLGPVLLIDTAGVDDRSHLGHLRIEKTKTMIPKINIAVYVLRSDKLIDKIDQEWIERLQKAGLPLLLVINEVKGYKADAYMAQQTVTFPREGMTYIGVDASKSFDQKKILKALSRLSVKDSEEERTLLEGLVKPNKRILLVCPIDSAAPKGRLILPQVQMIRDILDHRGLSLVVQTEEVPEALRTFKPELVITDSQAFGPVSQMVPDAIPLTSFSIIMARFKGKLKALVAGAQTIKGLHSGSKVLISEGCTHHRQCDDIGTVKIPRWLAQAGYTDLDLTWTSGGAFPDDVSAYDLVIHCGACMLTRREVLRRIDITLQNGVPIVNYGVLIAVLHGILDRALSPFQQEL